MTHVPPALLHAPGLMCAELTDCRGWSFRSHVGDHGTGWCVLGWRCASRRLVRGLSLRVMISLQRPESHRDLDRLRSHSRRMFLVALVSLQVSAWLYLLSLIWGGETTRAGKSRHRAIGTCPSPKGSLGDGRSTIPCGSGAPSGASGCESAPAYRLYLGLVAEWDRLGSCCSGVSTTLLEKAMDESCKAFGH